MRWKEDVHKPYHGEQRTIRLFAVFPIRCVNGECVWLEKVNLVQEFRIDPNYHWVNKRFERGK